MDKNKQMRYFIQADALKLDSFIQVPKLLFKHPRYKEMSLTSRLMYSLYLNRYNDTKYKDENGPYIIFGDSELQEFLGISRITCIRNKKDLVSLDLIKTKKTTGYNKIYLMNYRNPDTSEFYTPEDLESYSFYRFPRVFLNEEFDELTLNAKFLYTYYFDWMCLSQMNYIVDDNERIYFKENNKKQEKNLLLNNSTIIAAKKLLIASDLLIEDQGFGKEKHYYLLKLDNYNHEQLIKYNLMEKKEQSVFLKELSKMNRAVITTPKESIKQLRKSLGIDVKTVLKMLQEKGITVSPRTYNRYEDGTRKFPKEIYSIVWEYLSEETNQEVSVMDKKTTVIQKRYMEEDKKDHKNRNMIHQELDDDTSKNKKDTSKMKLATNKYPKELQTETENSVVNATKKATNINYTENYTNNNYINNSNSLIEEDDLLITDKIIKQLNNIDKIDKQMIKSCFKRLNGLTEFTIKKKKYDKEYLLSLMKIFENFDDDEVERYFTLLIERIKNSGYAFKTPDNIINCFLTFLFNDLLEGKDKIEEYIVESLWATRLIKHSVNEEKEARTVPISNYKWWES